MRLRLSIGGFIEVADLFLFRDIRGYRTLPKANSVSATKSTPIKNMTLAL
jgi:hypothetical protein